jgi:hypothetical protein
MTIELRDTGDFGFLLPASEILPTAKETVEGLIAFWNYVDEHIRMKYTSQIIHFAYYL